MSQPAFLFSDYPATATATSTSTLSGTAAENALIQTEDTYLAPASTASFDFVVDLGTPQTFDAIGLVGSYIHGISVAVRASTDNFVASDVAIMGATTMSAIANAAWSPFTSDTYRYWQVTISDHSTALKLSHICLCRALEVPYLEEDSDEYSSKTDASFLISPSGIFIGASHNKTMREMSLNFGDVTASEVAALNLWVSGCLRSPRPFFFVPDQAGYAVYYGWTDSAFSAPLQNGLYRVGALKFNTRAV